MDRKGGGGGGGITMIPMFLVYQLIVWWPLKTDANLILTFSQKINLESTDCNPLRIDSNPGRTLGSVPFCLVLFFLYRQARNNG